MDFLEEYELKKSYFISMKEVFSHFLAKYNSVLPGQLAEILHMKMVIENTEELPVYFLSSGQQLALSEPLSPIRIQRDSNLVTAFFLRGIMSGKWESNVFMNSVPYNEARGAGIKMCEYGYERVDIQRFFDGLNQEIDFSKAIHSNSLSLIERKLAILNYTAQKKNGWIPSDNGDTDKITKWDNFAGKNTALMMIAGMSIALEQAGGKYIRGGRLNKSEVARTAISAINEYGDGTEITPKALTDLLSEALSEKARKLEVQKNTD